MMANPSKIQPRTQPTQTRSGGTVIKLQRETATAANSMAGLKAPIGCAQRRQRPRSTSQLANGTNSDAPSRARQVSQQERPKTMDFGSSTRLTTDPIKLPMNGADATSHIHTGTRIRDLSMCAYCRLRLRGDR